MNEETILVLKDISKSFFGAMVLDNISLEVRKGEILGLVGENGAGKSTLMNILGGVLPPDTGSMELKGHSFTPANPRDADKAGIAFIHQELSLFSNLTVAENMFIDDLPTGVLWSVQFDKMRTEAREYIEKFGVHTTPDTKVETLSMGIRQTIEITKALIKNAEIIIFDEPTTSLSQTEKDNLFKIIPQLKDQGVTIIYISHIIEDVFHLCDRIAVLRDGYLVGVEDKDKVGKSQVIKMMVGRELNQVYPTVEKTIGDVIYRARNIQRGTVVRDISFDLRVGEIVGLFGLMGAGRTELARCLFGADPIDSGEIEYKGKLHRKVSPELNIKQGVSFVTEDRRQEGLLMPKTVKENIVLAKLNDLQERLGMVSSKREDQEADKVIKELNVKVKDKNKQAAKNLSGGNQQKVVLSKWILKEPSMFVMDEPTRGVDVGSKYEIYTIINNMAKNGATVLFISSEMEELMGLCDRIMVMSKGKIVAEMPKSEYNQEKIISYAIGGAELTMQSVATAPTFSAKKLIPLLQYGVYIIFVVLAIFFSVMNHRFATVNNGLLLLQQAAPIGIAVIGMTFVLIVAGLDLSVAQNMYLSAVLIAIAMESMRKAGTLGTVWSFVFIFAIALTTGAAIGAVNGVLVARWKIVPFLATLATQGIARGVALIASHSKVFFVPELGPISNGRWLGFPVVTIILFVLIFVFDYILRRTTFGRQLMAIGNDSASAQKIGINVNRNVFFVYLICGVLAGLAGLLAAGQGGAIAVYFHQGDEFLIISSAVLGGISLFGGKGSVFPGALIGIILVGTIVNGMTMMNASPYAYTIVRGAIIFLAVMVDSINYKGELR